MSHQLRLKLCFLALVFLAPISSARADDLANGKYYFQSAINDKQPHCIDKKTQDNRTIQMYYCNAGHEQVFTVAGSDGNHSISDYNTRPLGLTMDHTINGKPINMVISGGTPETPDVQTATWKFQRNPDGSYTVNCVSNCFAEGYTPTPTACLDRRNPDKRNPDNGDGRVQVIGCYGIAGQRWFITPSSR